MKLSKPYVVGITGGIASGKSAVDKILDKHNIPVIDADVLARKAVEPGSKCIEEIKEAFGDSVINEDASLNREALGRLIFSQARLKEKLNSIVHPLIFSMIRDELLEHSKDEVVFIDMALLVENLEIMKNKGIEFHEVWVVSIPLEIQINRLMKRDKISRREALEKINSQISKKKRERQSNIIIDNSRGLEYLEDMVEVEISNLYSRIKKWRNNEKV